MLPQLQLIVEEHRIQNGLASSRPFRLAAHPLKRLQRRLKSSIKA